MDKIQRYPLSGTFEITARCNLSCEMCYVRIDHKRMKELGGKERTTEEWIDMARQARDAGTISLLLTGGEPMLRPDFCEIYEEIAKMGFILTLYTNATMITPEIMKVLKKYPPHIIGITIYGASEDTYRRVCGNGEAYNRMLDGVQQLLKLSSNIQIRTTIIKDNKDDLNDIELLVERLQNLYKKEIDLNISRVVFKSIRNSITEPSKCRLTPEENAILYCKKYFNRVEKYSKDEEYRNIIKSKVERKKENIQKYQNENKQNKDINKNNKTFYGCGAGCDEYYITWDGKMLPCTLMGKYYTNPFKEGLENAWNRMEDVIVVPKVPHKCLDCKYKEFCFTCPANRYCESGDEEGIPDYLCKEAEAFYNILKIES